MGKFIGDPGESDKKPEGKDDLSDKKESADKKEKRVVSRPRISGERVKEVIGYIGGYAFFLIPWLFIAGGIVMAILLHEHDGFLGFCEVICDIWWDSDYSYLGGASLTLGGICELLGAGVSLLISGLMFEWEDMYFRIMAGVCGFCAVSMIVACTCGGVMF